MIRLHLFFLSGLLLLACAGCGKTTAAAAEGKERNSTLYRKALEAERAGDIKDAISQYRNLLVEEPRAFSVHLQLATLLQDYEENYIAAIYHYQQYLLLRPEAEKSTLAKDRIRVSEQLLAPQILRKVGDTVEGLTPAHLLKENDRLNRLIVQLQSEKSTFADATERAEKERAAAQSETERLRGLLNSMRVTDTVAKPAEALPKKSGQETKPAERPDAKSLKSLRDEAAALAAEGSRAAATPLPPPPPPTSRNATAEDVLRNVQQKVSGDTAVKKTEPPPVQETPPDALSALIRGDKPAKKKEPAATGAAPRTHVVKPGERLYGIAEKYYGDSTHWKKIRDANKANIDPDWRVRAGQILVIP